MDNQRGLLGRVARKLEASVGDAFARVFGGAVVPEEVAGALRREAADGVRSLDGNRLLAPNDYVITLGAADYEKLGADTDLTTDTFTKHLATYIHEQGWQTYGDVVVRFQQSSNLRTGQVRARGAVNPDVNPRPTASGAAPSQSDHAFSAEPGVSPMSDNPSYRGGQGQGGPGDDYYDERYGRPQDEPHGGQEPGGPYPPDPGSYPPDQGGYSGPGQGGYPVPRHLDQGGYPDQGQGGYPPPYEQQRPATGYGAPPGYDPSYQQPPAGYSPPAGGQPGYGEYGSDYGRPPARHEEYNRFHGQHEQQRPAYPDQGGGPSYPEQGAPSYGRQDYGQPEYPRYGEAPPAGYDYGQPAGQPGGQPSGGGGYEAPPSGGYGDAPGGPGGQSYGQDYGQNYGQDYYGQDYGQNYGQDYGQPQAGGGGYDNYGQQGYPMQTMVTLQLDDGSGRTYQLHEGTNVVGRGQDAQFRLPDTGVSRRHLEIRWDGRVALLSDLNSTNGTTVNNAPVQEWQLADGDVIRLGHSEIIVRVH